MLEAKGQGQEVVALPGVPEKYRDGHLESVSRYLSLPLA